MSLNGKKKPESIPEATAIASVLVCEPMLQIICDEEVVYSFPNPVCSSDAPYLQHEFNLFLSQKLNEGSLDEEDIKPIATDAVKALEAYKADIKRYPSANGKKNIAPLLEAKYLFEISKRDIELSKKLKGKLYNLQLALQYQRELYSARVAGNDKYGDAWYERKCHSAQAKKITATEMLNAVTLYIEDLDNILRADLTKFGDTANDGELKNILVILQAIKIDAVKLSNNVMDLNFKLEKSFTLPDELNSEIEENYFLPIEKLKEINQWVLFVRNEAAKGLDPIKELAISDAPTCE
ncbi:MAG: hypothetical protein NTU49_07155 [Gammaproteobacteria bacterium]|nr:hypothetical protein [Gammaproteobacteria bacterium]